MGAGDTFAVGYRNDIAVAHSRRIERRLMMGVIAQLGVLILVGVLVVGCLVLAAGIGGELTLLMMLPFIISGASAVALAMWQAVRLDRARSHRSFAAAPEGPTPFLVMEPGCIRVAHSRGVLMPYAWDQVVLHVRPADLRLPELVDLHIGAVRLELVGSALTPPLDQVLAAQAHLRRLALDGARGAPLR